MLQKEDTNTDHESCASTWLNPAIHMVENPSCCHGAAVDRLGRLHDYITRFGCFLFFVWIKQDCS